MNIPVWNVIVNEINGDEIRTYNVFRHSGFYNGLQKAIKKSKTKEEFAKALKTEIMYYYWSKCEWEIVITPWAGKKDGVYKKINVYDQLELNWDAFVDCTWKAFGKT